MPINSQHDPHRPRLMVTGASGTLGHWICRMAINTWCVHGIHWQQPIGIAGVNAVRADLTCTTALKDLFSVVRPKAVIHAAAITQPALCENNPQATHAINVEVPRLLSALCADQGVPFIFTSTDLVFDGLDAPYGERCPVRPVTVYGRQKAQAEATVLKTYPRALVCRMPLMFGLGPRRSGNFSLQMLSAIQKGRSIQLFTDEFRTPVDFQSAAQGVLNLLGRSQGILHLGGRSRVSRFELGLLMARQMDISPSMLAPIAIDALAFGVARSPDCSMNSHKAYRLGYNPLPLHPAVKRVVGQFNVISDV